MADHWLQAGRAVPWRPFSPWLSWLLCVRQLLLQHVPEKCFLPQPSAANVRLPNSAVSRACFCHAGWSEAKQGPYNAPSSGPRPAACLWPIPRSLSGVHQDLSLAFDGEKFCTYSTVGWENGGRVLMMQCEAGSWAAFGEVLEAWICVKGTERWGCRAAWYPSANVQVCHRQEASRVLHVQAAGKLMVPCSGMCLLLLKGMPCFAQGHAAPCLRAVYASPCSMGACATSCSRGGYATPCSWGVCRALLKVPRPGPCGEARGD